jgi:serine O-acetyltransferase
VSDLLSILARDRERYRSLGGIRRNLGFWMVATHRLGQEARAIDNPLLAIPLRATCKAASMVWQSVWGVNLSEEASLGPGFCLIHPRDVVVGPARIGEDCLVFHEVTIEGGSAGPRLGDRIDVYAGAKVVGDVQIGDDAKIGANCVVTTDVEPGCNVVTAASRVIPASIVNAFGPRRSTKEDGRPQPSPGVGPSATTTHG